MFNKIIASFFLVLATLAGPTAHAIVVTLDDNSLTVARPLSGTTTVNFTGHITLTTGFEFTSFGATSLWTAGGNAGGDIINSGAPDTDFNLNGILFYVTVSALDNLGLYAFNLEGGLADVNFAECPIGVSGLCNNFSLNYSLDVVDTSVPEPESGALVLLGLAGLGFLRRRVA